MLEVERNYIETNRDKLIVVYGGRFLVIKGENVTGAFDSLPEAMQGAAMAHGLENVLIRRATDNQMQVSIPALTLGILSANFSYTDSRTS